MIYAELHCLSNFTFLRGASHPAELVAQADELGYQAIAITDECSLAGIVRAWQEARQRRIKLICGAEFTLECGLQLVVLAPHRQAYAELCALISRARQHSAKGQYQLSLSELSRHCKQGLLIWRPDINHPDVQNHAVTLQDEFNGRLWMGFSAHCQQQLQPQYLHHYQLARFADIPMLACGHIHMHQRQRKPLLDVLTAIRLKSPVNQLGKRLQENSEAYLKPLPLLQQHYPQALLEESCRVAARCHFQLNEISYQYPEEALPRGRNASDFLRELALHGAARRWPGGVPAVVRAQINRELAIIAELQYEHYFLTVHDIVQFARSQHILCQGRGSAANSTVCYCLYITEVDPSQGELLFERFISRERKEKPDIDVDFEHERREEVMQYIYRKYGRSHAALAATVISYRRRSAIRDVGRALGMDEGLLSTLSKNLAWWDSDAQLSQRLQEARLDLRGQQAQQFIQLVETLRGFPRHLSQHVGGFVIAREVITSLVPIENAAMADRTIIQWDKEDLETLGLMKVDILALGMLSALRKSLGYISHTLGQGFALEDIPKEDPATYDMLCKADSIGVFQVESRAQMSMLPRLQPRQFYDLVVQIAIVRPGPIQGGMVHPYLRRRQGLEGVSYENAGIEKVLQRTLGIPIFQEQVIQLAMVAAGFSGGEADQLRRAMASWGKNGQLESFRDKLVSGMLKNGYQEDFAQRLFSQMQGFGAYGFPESHSASFALLAYASAWIKRHYPAEFYCGLLNSLPMGFYSASQLCQDARRHGVDVRPVCINHSHWQHSLEYEAGQPALRLGFRLVKGFKPQAAEAITAQRQQRLFLSITELLQRLTLSKREQQQLVQADAFHCFDSHRHQSLWEVTGYQAPSPLLASAPLPRDAITLAPASEIEEVRRDYQHSGLSLRRHPVKILRDMNQLPHCLTAAELPHRRNNEQLSVAGLVTCRQRPGTASGVLFLTLEDETGNSNIVVWAAVQQRYRQEILTGKLLRIFGQLQINTQGTAAPVIHLIATDIQHCGALSELVLSSHDFH